MVEKVQLLSKWIDEASFVCTLCHTHPDGDALGSSAAMYSYLTASRGKQAMLLLPDPQSAGLDFLLAGTQATSVHSEAAAAIARCDLLICLDFNTISRTETLSEECGSFRGRKVLIDHHAAPDLEAFDLAFSTTEVSSACELLFEVLMQMPDVRGNAGLLPPRCAYALMAGMTTDTNNFANSVFPGTLRMASALLEAGADRDDILLRLYSSGREQRLRAMGDILLNRMVITPEGAALIVLTADVLQSYGLLDGESEGFVNMPLEIKDVRLSIFARQEEDGRFRVSLRSKKGTSARSLAASVFHGGGHEQASGGRILIPEDIPDASAAAAYVAAATARFLQQQDAIEQ